MIPALLHLILRWCATGPHKAERSKETKKSFHSPAISVPHFNSVAEFHHCIRQCFLTETILL